MKPVRIDFARPGWRRALHRSGPLTWLAGLLGLGLCAAAAVSGQRLLERQRHDSAQLTQALTRARAPVAAPVALPQARISAQQAGAVNAAVLQLNLPWRALHDAIGEATPPSIALLALEPDAKKRSIKLTAEAKTSDAMIDYVAQLKRQELFAGVTLTRHEINEADPNRPIRFQLEAEWSATGAMGAVSAPSAGSAR